MVALTGAGRGRAAEVSKWAITEHNPEMVMSVGFGGATRSVMQPGDLVLATELYRLDGTPFYWDAQQLGVPLLPDSTMLLLARNAVELAAIDFELGPLVNLPTIAKTAGMKRWLGETLGAAAVDMESYVVAEIAREAEVPFAAVRAIVDVVAFDLPDFAAQVDSGPSTSRILPAIRYLARNPGDAAGIARLGIAAARARHSLTIFFAEFMAELRARSGADFAEAAG
jgi:nucleoside phosphorylase